MRTSARPSRSASHAGATSSAWAPASATHANSSTATTASVAPCFMRPCYRTCASIHAGALLRHARSNATRRPASSPALSVWTPAARAAVATSLEPAGLSATATIATPSRAAVAHSPAIVSNPAAAPIAITRDASRASAAATAAGSAKPSVAAPLGTRHSRGATDAHASASGTSSARIVPAGVASRAISTTRRRASPGRGADAVCARLSRSSAATSQSARIRPRSRGASSSSTSAMSATTACSCGPRATRTIATPAGHARGVSSTESTPRLISRSLCASNAWSAANSPSASGCGSGSAPLPFGVVRTGAGSDSASARIHFASSAATSSPTTSTGRDARATASATASSASLAGAAAAARRTVVATGRAGAAATPAPSARCTAPRGWAIAACAACAIQCAAAAGSTETLAFRTGSSSRASPAPSEITTIPARSRLAWAAPSTIGARPAPSDTSATPGASPSSAVTAAIMQAAVTPAVSTTARPRFRAASMSARSAPAAANTRDTSARASTSAITAATLLRLTAANTRSARERLEDGPHALERRPEIGLRGGVGEAQVALAVRAERGARQRGHAGLVEQPLGDLRRGTLRPGDVREDVERAARTQALHAGQLVEAVDENVAPPLELRHHATGLLALQRGDAGELHEGGRARRRVHHQACDVLDERLREDAVAQPPARHRVGLREAVQDDRALRHAGAVVDGDELALVEELPVDLVGQHRNVARRGQRRDALDLRAIEHAARRIRRRVDDDQLRARREALLEHVEVEAELARLAQRNRYRRGAHEIDHRFVDRKAGVRVDHLVAVPRQRH